MAPLGVTWACMPFFTEAMSSAATSATTLKCRGETTTTWLVVVELASGPGRSRSDPSPELGDDEEDEDPLTCSSTVRSTEATVPVIVARRVAESRSSWAWLRADFAAATAALSDESWVEEASASTSSSYCASAASSWACAEVSAASSELVSRVASRSPLTTLSPAATYTFVTRPLTAKSRSASRVGSSVPVAATVCW